MGEATQSHPSEAPPKRIIHRWSLNFTDDTTNVSAPPQPQRSQGVRAAIDEHMHPPGFPSSQSARDPSHFLQTSSQSKTASSNSKGSTKSSTKGSTKSSTSNSNNTKSNNTNNTNTNTNCASRERELMHSAYSHSWTVAFAPMRALCTAWFALYITGDRLNAFTLVSTVTVFFMQLRSLFATREAFRAVHKIYRLSVVSVLPQIIVHILIISVGIAYALYKANVLGFLPTTESDWIALLPLHTVAPMTFRHAAVLN